MTKIGDTSIHVNASVARWGQLDGALRQPALEALAMQNLSSHADAISGKNIGLEKDPHI
jgi:hypothetical protein